MNLYRILIELEKQGWKLESDFLDHHENFLQDLVDETEKQLTLTCCTELCECSVDCVETKYNKDFTLVCKKCENPLIAL